MHKSVSFLIGAAALTFPQELLADAMCQRVPECEELGYKMSASECEAKGAVDILKCPFNDAKAYCPEDCRTFPLSSCDDSIGECQQCASYGTWRYKSCYAGYKNNDGVCVPMECNETNFPYSAATEEEALNDNLRGNPVICKSGADFRYGYENCNQGWDLYGHKCYEHRCGEGYVAVGACPTFAIDSSCNDVCFEGSTLMINFVCAEGLIKDGGRCVKRRTGEIYYYNDTPIGVVFYDDVQTSRVVALTYVNGAGEASKKRVKMPWSDNNVDIEDIENYSSKKVDMDGKNNTRKIIDHASTHEYTARAATAADTYVPEICKGTGSECDRGNWYLPASGELKLLYNFVGVINDTLKTIEGAGVITPRTSGEHCHAIWSSTEVSANTVYPASGQWSNYCTAPQGYGESDEPNHWMNSKLNSDFGVRPIMIIHNDISI